MHRGRAWTINLQAIGSTRGGTRSHINVTGILVGKFKLRDRAYFIARGGGQRILKWIT